MLNTVVRLTFAAAWVLLGSALLFREQLFDPEVYARRDPNFLNLGGVLALVLAGFNVLRWLIAWRQARRRTALRNPLATREQRPRREEYNPELDFTKRDRG